MTSFETNSLGLGSFNYYVRNKQRKSILIDYNGKEIKFALPKARETGFILKKLNEKESDKSIKFKIKTNLKTLKKKQVKEFLLF